MPAFVFSADRLRAARRQCGLSRDQFAVRIGRTVSTVTKYEIGQLTPSASVLGAIAAVLDCEVGDLYVTEPATAGRRRAR
jgi:transcriptional regulator with XRE-family HTH domain